MTDRVRPGRWGGTRAAQPGRVRRCGPDAGLPGRAADRGAVGPAAVAVGFGGLALAAVVVLVPWVTHAVAVPPGPFAAVEEVFAAAGLRVCAVSAAPDPLAPTARASRTYLLAAGGCAGETVAVVADEFAGVRDRDAAVRALPGGVRVVDGVTVSVRGSGGAAVRAALDPALHAAGAR